MKKAKNIVKSIGYLFVGMLVALCVYTFVMTDILKKDYANVFGYTYFVVATGSMSGTIEVNDVVIVKLTDDVEFRYKVDNVYQPSAERSLRFDDPDLAVQWRPKDTDSGTFLLSDKDLKAPFLKDAEFNFEI